MGWFFTVVLFVVVIFFLLYVRALMKRVQSLVLGWFSIRAELKDYQQHLERVYKMPSYYNEPTLEKLIEHTKFLESAIDEFEHDTYLVGLFDQKDALEYDRQTSESSQDEELDIDHKEEQQETIDKSEVVRQVY